MKLKKNPLIKLFLELKILKEENLLLFHLGTRDIEEIKVLMDKESECLILDQCVEDLNDYYSLNENYSKEEHFTLIKDKYVETPPLEDDYRRYSFYNKFLKDSSILDFGCGKGGFLRLLKENNISQNLKGLELNKKNNENINLGGIECLFDLTNTTEKFDFIFLNHVFEHLDNPVGILKDLISRLNKEGKIIIEIPHGNDFLIKRSGLNSFRKFTFWSEHLCLYTEKFISSLFEKINLDEYTIFYKQRYDLNNHLNWFKEGKPGGHNKKIFKGHILDDYNSNLIKNCETDTLMIVIGEKSKVFCDNLIKS